MKRFIYLPSAGDFVPEGSPVLVRIGWNQYPGRLLEASGKLLRVYFNNGAIRWVMEDTVTKET